MQCVEISWCGCPNKIPETGGLKPQTFISPTSGIRVVQAQGLVNSHLLEDTYVSSHNGERPISGDSSYKDTNRIRPGSTLMLSLNLNSFCKGPSPNTITLEISVSIYEFWGDTVQSTAQSLHIFPSNDYFLRACLCQTLCWGKLGHDPGESLPSRCALSGRGQTREGTFTVQFSKPVPRQDPTCTTEKGRTDHTWEIKGTISEPLAFLF